MSVRLSGGGAIGDAVAAARAFGEKLELGHADLARLCIVVEELIANLYDHGGVTAADEVQLDLTGEAGCIRVSIVDPGLPFDPWSAPPPVRDAKHGGAGLNLVRAWAELASYRPTENGNHLELRVPVGRPAGGAGT